MQDLDSIPSELNLSKYSRELAMLLLSKQGQTSRPCQTFKSSLLHGSIARYIQICKENGANRPTRDKPVLEILFNSSADPLNIKSNSLVAVEDLRRLLDNLLPLDPSPSLQAYLRKLRNATSSFIADFVRIARKGPRFIATNTEYLDQPCCYAYTYQGYLESPQFTPDAMIPIKVGFAGSNGASRIENQLNESSPQLPLVLFAWPARDKADARQTEKLIHTAILDNDFSRTQGGGAEWFEISPRALDAITDEIGLPPKVVTPLSDYQE